MLSVSEKCNYLELPVLITSRLNIVPGGFPFKLADPRIFITASLDREVTRFVLLLLHTFCSA